MESGENSITCQEVNFKCHKVLSETLFFDIFSFYLTRKRMMYNTSEKGCDVLELDVLAGVGVTGWDADALLVADDKVVLGSHIFLFSIKTKKIQ